MTVKKIHPKELAEDLVFRLNHLYHAELGGFIVMADNRKEILYINKKVPEKDIEGFLEVVMFPDYAVADDESPTGRFLDYVYEKYGFSTYRALMDAHELQMERKEKARAKERAEAIIPLIEKEADSENPVVKYDELLNYEIWKHGYGLVRHTSKHTSNYGNVYEFYFGFLLGAGMLDAGADARAGYIKDTAGIMRQIDDVEVLKKIYTVAKTHLGILQQKGGAS